MQQLLSLSSLHYTAIFLDQLILAILHAITLHPTAIIVSNFLASYSFRVANFYDLCNSTQLFNSRVGLNFHLRHRTLIKLLTRKTRN